MPGRKSADPATALSPNSRTPSSATEEAASAGIRSRLTKSRLSTVLIGSAVVWSDSHPINARAGSAAIPASMLRRVNRAGMRPSPWWQFDAHHGRNHALCYPLAAGDRCDRFSTYGGSGAARYLQVPARGHEARLVRDHDQLSPIASTELGQHPAYVRACGCGADVDFRRDLVVRQTTADSGQHFTFPFGQLVEPGMVGDPGGP